MRSTKSMILFHNNRRVIVEFDEYGAAVMREGITQSGNWNLVTVQATEDIWHGDWKTQIARKRHDIFRKGDTSRILKVFRNFDGIHATVENHEGVKVDCPVHQLDFVSDNNTYEHPRSIHA